MGVVLREGAQAHDAVQRARRLEAVAGAELGHAQRQVAIGLLTEVEDLHVARAVHRLDGQLFAFGRLAREHVRTELFPVPGLLPETPVHDLGGLDLDVAVNLQAAAHVGFHRAVERPTLGVPEDHALGFFLQVEEVHGPADLAVVALLGLFQPRQMGFEVGLAGPRRTIDALELSVAMVAAPIGAGQLHQFERLADRLRRGQVRPQAQVLPLALAIDRDRLALGQVGDDLGLVGLADRLEVGDGLGAVPDFAHDLLVAVDDLLHALFDLGQIIQAERRLAGEVVIEPVLDGRADRDLRAGEQFLHRLGHDVAGVVADGVERLGAVARQDLELAAARQRAVEVVESPIELDEHGAFLQRFGDGGGDVTARGAVFELALRAVGENQIDHDSHVHVREADPSGVLSRGWGTGS